MRSEKWMGNVRMHDEEDTQRERERGGKEEEKEERRGGRMRPFAEEIDDLHIVHQRRGEFLNFSYMSFDVHCHRRLTSSSFSLFVGFLVEENEQNVFTQTVLGRIK